MTRFLSIGECMVELADAGNGLLRKGFAGDTFNTAWYARRLLPASWDVAYLSAVGDEAMSRELLAFMADSGINTEFVRRIAGAAPGLYMISLNNGERSFSYWRDTSAARRLADDAAHVRRAVAEADVIHLSGITLAILPEAAAWMLIDVLAEARKRGAQVAFDSNYRSRLWSGRSDVGALVMAAARAASVVLPGVDDEQAIFGERDAAVIAARYQSVGAELVLVKDGASGAMLFDGHTATKIPAVKPRAVVDTTAAGDSFAAGFLARLALGDDATVAAPFAAGIAAQVVAQRGALVETT